MLASIPASRLNQIRRVLGIPLRFTVKSSRSKRKELTGEPHESFSDRRSHLYCAAGTRPDAGQGSAEITLGGERHHHDGEPTGPATSQGSADYKGDGAENTGQSTGPGTHPNKQAIAKQKKAHPDGSRDTSPQ
jgi:hypothetical protein